MPNPDTQQTLPTTTDPELYDVTTLTRIRATNADVEAIIAGRITDPIEFTQAELVDGQARRVTRRYEPVAELELPEPTSLEGATDWVHENQDHPALEGYDWEHHERVDLIDAIVERDLRLQHLARDLYDRLDDVKTTSIGAEDEIGDIQDDLAEIIRGTADVKLREIDDETGDPEPEATA